MTGVQTCTLPISVKEVLRANRFDERIDGWVCLAVDVDAQVGPRGDEFGKCRDVFVVGDANCGDLGCVEFIDLGIDTARALQVVIVEGEEDAVA